MNRLLAARRQHAGSAHFTRTHIDGKGEEEGERDGGERGKGERIWRKRMEEREKENS